MAVIALQVQTYSGHRADERPIAFTIGTRTFRVNDIVDRWYGPDHDYFKLIADDQNLYLMRHDCGTDLWELVMTETTCNI